MKTIKIIGRLSLSVIALYLFYLCWCILGTIDSSDFVSVLLFIVIVTLLLKFAVENTIRCFKRK